MKSKIFMGILCAVVLFAITNWLFTGEKKSAPPSGVLARKATLVDVKTLELITLTSGEWMQLGTGDGYYKHPETGQYTVSVAMKCESCEVLIPRVSSTDENAICPRCEGAVFK